MKYPIIFLGIAALLTACQPKHKQIMISDTTIQASIAAITTANPEVDVTLVTRGVEQMATLWQENDGSEADFQDLVSRSYAGTCEEKQMLYNRLAYIIEQCNQSADMLNNTLQEPTTLRGKVSRHKWIGLSADIVRWHTSLRICLPTRLLMSVY